MLTTTPVPPNPVVFISYSHDSDEHRAWVLRLADRLTHDGVHVHLDQYDLRPGDEMSSFMEGAVSNAGRTVAVCSADYVRKADSLQGGAGFEKTLLAGAVMANQRENRVIPLLRNNDAATPLPAFLGTRRYLDFRDDRAFETSYGELLAALYDRPGVPRPPLGNSPFSPRDSDGFGTPSFGFAKAALGQTLQTVTFNYSDNDGAFIVGDGALAFETRWSAGSRSAIHAYHDAPGITAIALVDDAASITGVKNARRYNTSSRARTAKVGDIVLWWNVQGAVLATQIDVIECRTAGDRYDVLRMTYAAISAGQTAFG